ncbi:MAG: condensation domain-containing protein, partial [Blastocatellia bacterium]
MKDTPVQEIAPGVSVHPVFVDLSRLAKAARESECGRLLTQFNRVPFNLFAAPLSRVLLLKLGETDNVVSLTMHHIISDGWSLGVLVNELMRLYAGVRIDLPPQPDLPLQYADFAVWQRNWLKGEVLRKQLSYWTGQLGGAPRLLRLPTDRPRRSVQNGQGATEGLVLNPELARKLRVLSRGEGATLFMTLLAGFQILMGRQSGQDDIVVGCPVSGRTRIELEGLIGCFINAVAIRTGLSGNPAFKEVLSRVCATALAAYAHQDLPFDALVDALHLEHRRDYAPVFQVVFNFQNAPLPKLVLPGLTVRPVAVDTGSANYDMTLYLRDLGESVAASMVYNSDLFDRATVQNVLHQYEAILLAIAADSGVRLNSLMTMNEAERGQISMSDSDRKKTNLQKLMGARRRAVKLSPQAQVESRFLQENQPLPLLITPRDPTVDLADWASANVEFIETELLKYGAILFRGFEVESPAAFERFARSVTPDLVDYIEGSSPRIRLKDKVYSSTEYPPEFFISLHNELSYAHKWPGRLFFYCALAPLQGGETVIADCRQVVPLLHPIIVDKFERKGVRYVRRLHGGRGPGLSWQSVFETTDRAAVEAYCTEGAIEFEWCGDGSLRTS